MVDVVQSDDAVDRSIAAKKPDAESPRDDGEQLRGKPSPTESASVEVDGGRVGQGHGHDGDLRHKISSSSFSSSLVSPHHNWDEQGDIHIYEYSA